MTHGKADNTIQFARVVRTQTRITACNRGLTSYSPQHHEIIMADVFLKLSAISFLVEFLLFESFIYSIVLYNL